MKYLVMNMFQERIEAIKWGHHFLFPWHRETGWKVQRRATAAGISWDRGKRWEYYHLIQCRHCSCRCTKCVCILSFVEPPTKQQRHKCVKRRSYFLLSQEKKLKAELNKTIQKRKKKIYNSLLETIEKHMQPCYKSMIQDFDAFNSELLYFQSYWYGNYAEICNFLKFHFSTAAAKEQTGTGSLKCLRETIENHVEAVKDNMFKEAQDVMLSKLDELKVCQDFLL